MISCVESIYDDILFVEINTHTYYVIIIYYIIILPMFIISSGLDVKHYMETSIYFKINSFCTYILLERDFTFII